MTRFYLQQKEDPHGPSISLYVGNLPTGLSQRQYEKILLDIIGRGKQRKSISFFSAPEPIKQHPKLYEHFCNQCGHYILLGNDVMSVFFLHLWYFKITTLIFWNKSI